MSVPTGGRAITEAHAPDLSDNTVAQPEASIVNQAVELTQQENIRQPRHEATAKSKSTKRLFDPVVDKETRKTSQDKEREGDQTHKENKVTSSSR